MGNPDSLNKTMDQSKCALCPDGQADSTECKDMFTAWLLSVSVYNALVPGVPVDLTLCCPCMTKRFLFNSASDVTATSVSDIVEIMQATPEDALTTVRRFRKAATIREYREE